MSAAWDASPERSPGTEGPLRAADSAGLSSKPVVRVWDGATRMVHWLLVVLLGVSWWTASHQQMDYHRYSGYALLGVLVFRLYWGVFGSTTARFVYFVRGPGPVWRYLRSKGRHAVPGHNPLGALSVLALLGLLLAQVGLGLFSVDVDGLESGPLSRWVSFETGRECARLHHLGFNVLKALVVLHVGAILCYALFKRDNLVRPMITGRKGWHYGPAPHLEFAPGWRALLGVALAGLLVWYIA
jgi:cytochrome b